MIHRLSAALWEERAALAAIADQLDILRDVVEQRSLAEAAALLPSLDPLLDDVRFLTLERELLVSVVADQWNVDDADLLVLAGRAATTTWGELLTLHVCAMHETALRMAAAGGRIEAVLAAMHLDVMPARWPRATYPASYTTEEGHGPASVLPGTQAGSLEAIA
jgi:nucleotide-binding universal stress UspA family protein